MSLSAGTRLGPYEIVSPLGAGGMGEVYRATDRNLKRPVAIKVLPAAVAADADRLARFQREAEVLAALNHPNIAAIYGLERTADLTALVMELVEGEDLSEKIQTATGSRQSATGKTHGLPLDEALAIAKQIADALEAAHEAGIVHRDLKPANIKVREDGTVKVLDFGLAKALDQGSGIGDQGSAHLANSPTITSPLTTHGMILGTAAYMSPEQARGKLVDKRSDVWAFGCVLFEMLTGRRAFDGDDATETISAVMKSEPDWTALPASVPADVRAIVMRCLVKDRKQRVPDVSVVRFALDGSLSGSNSGVGPSLPTRSWGRLVPWVMAAVSILVATWSLWRPVPSSPAPVVYSTIDGPDGYVIGEADPFLDLPSRTPMTFTADGRGLIILASVGPTPSALAPSRTRLFFRALDRPDLRPIPGTEGALAPFVSPDGKWIGFWASNELRKVPIEGGTPVTICPLLTASLGPFGAAWGPGDTIVFGDVPSGRIMRVSANGGTPVAVTAQPSVSSRRRHIAPAFLPDGRRILFSDTSTQDAADSRIMAQSLDGGAPALVVDQATDGRLLPTGQLAFIRLATLMTVAFDADRAVALGEPAAVMTNVMQGGTIRRRGVSNPGMAMFAVSGQGTLVAIRGGVAGVAANTITWADARGQASAEPAQGAPQGRRMNTRISPDGARALVTVFTPRRQEMWLADWARSVWTTCNNCDTELGVAIWSPDSHRLLLGRDGTLIEHALDGSAPDKILWREADRSVLPVAWLNDGRIAYMSSPNLTDYEVRMVEPGSSTSQEVLPLGVSLQAAVSPDGRWVAYTEVKRRGEDPNYSRDSNVIVQAFPGPGVRLQVSAGGATGPVWSRDSKTVYFSGADESLYAVDISSAGGLSAGRPRRVMPAFGSCFPSRCSDVADGPRFLGPAEPSGPAASVTRMDLVLNWTSTLSTGR